MPRNAKTAFLLSALAAAAGAGASIPYGTHFGAWHVTSITSLSGAGTDENGEADAASILIQDNDAGHLQASWNSGGPVIVSIDIKDCYGEDEDFSQSYRVEPAIWLRQSDGGAGRLEADFSAWLGQARFACRSEVRLDRFDLAELPAASVDFSEQLRWLSGTS